MEITRTDFIVAIFDASPEIIEKVQKIIKGEILPFSSVDLESSCNKTSIINHYKITDIELKTKDLSSSIIGRISIKDV